jgi:hypothetical protein
LPNELLIVNGLSGKSLKQSETPVAAWSVATGSERKIYVLSLIFLGWRLPSDVV